MILKIKIDNKTGSFKFFDGFEDISIEKLRVYEDPGETPGDPIGCSFFNRHNDEIRLDEHLFLPEYGSMKEVNVAFLTFSDENRIKAIGFHQAYLLNNQGDTIEKYY